MIRRSKGEWLFDIANHLLLVLLVIGTVYPLLHVFFASVSAPSRLIQHRGPLFAPLGFELGSYELVLDNPMIPRGYRNTIFVLVVGTAVNMLLTSLGAYVLSRKKLMLRNFIMFVVVFTMFFQGGLVPLYLQVRSLGLTDTLWALIFPTAINSWYLIIMRTSFMAIPDSLEESAFMDGANDFTVLFRIVIPLSIPVMAVMVLFYGVFHWNAWFQAMIFLRSRQLYPLQLVLREILVSQNTQSMTGEVAALDVEPVGETVKYATIIIATVPILFVYPFLQKYFVKGIMIGALKG